MKHSSSLCAIVCTILKHLRGEPHNLLFIVRDKSFVDQHSSSSVATSMLPSVPDDLPKAPVSQRSKKSDEPKPEKVIHKYGKRCHVSTHELRQSCSCRDCHNLADLVDSDPSTWLFYDGYTASDDERMDSVQVTIVADVEEQPKKKTRVENPMSPA